MLCASAMGPAWAVGTPRTRCCRGLRQAVCLTRSRLLARSYGDDSSSEFTSEGDLDLQAALVQQLEIQISNEALKEEIREDLKNRVERMKELGEQLKQQLDEDLGIEKFRMELQSRKNLSDALDQLNELEDQIAAMKQAAQADREDMAAWEAQSAAARNSGLFFKSLYKPEVLQGTDADSSSSLEGSGAAAATAAALPGSRPPPGLAAAAAVTSSAEEEVGSPFRMYLFAYMAAVLAVVVGQDLAGGSPSWGLDALYGVIGTALGVNAWLERGALAALVAHKAAAAAAAAEGSSSSSSSSSSGGAGLGQAVRSSGAATSSMEE